MLDERKGVKPRFTVYEIVLIALLSAIILAVQVVLAPLPNIELVSLLVILYTLTFRYKALFIIYIFVLLEGLIYGFGTWWFCYLYIWTILWGITMVCRNITSPFLWAVISGAYGLFFGLLCAITYLFIGGPSMALSYWISGIPFDIPHCIGNFVLALVLFRPLHTLLDKLAKSSFLFTKQK